MVRRAVLVLFALALTLGSWSAMAQPQPDDAIIPNVEPLDEVPEPVPEPEPEQDEQIEIPAFLRRQAN